MGFALWIDNDTAWAEGTHEYRPMGAAVISVTAQFHARDFDPRRPRRYIYDLSFTRFFASLVELNDYLRASKPRPPRPRQAPSRPSRSALT